MDDELKKLSPVEITTKYATTVETLQDAFVFIMQYVDALGTDPFIKITPIHSYSMSDMDMEDPPCKHFFEVMVSSMREEE